MKYQLEAGIIFQKHFISHKKAGRKQVLKKIEQLLFELERHPTTGTGKPERLKGVEDIDRYAPADEIQIWSRRIDSEHRLVYRIYEQEQFVYLMLCQGHYIDLQKYDSYFPIDED